MTVEHSPDNHESLLFASLHHLEFRKFVENAERQLFALFRSIDKDGNGKLDKLELQTAFKSAGLTLSNRRLSEFFDDMDFNNDGYVTFDEWRLVFYFNFTLNAPFLALTTPLGVSRIPSDAWCS